MRLLSKETVGISVALLSLVIPGVSLMISWRADVERRESSRASLSFSRADYISVTPFGTEIRLLAKNVGSHAALEPRFWIWTCTTDFTGCLDGEATLANGMWPGSMIEIPVWFKRKPPMYVLVNVTYVDEILHRSYEDSFFAQWLADDTLIHLSPQERERLLRETSRLVKGSRAIAKKWRDEHPTAGPVCGVLPSIDLSESAAGAVEVERASPPPGAPISAESRR